MERTNSLEIWAWLQRRNVDSVEGSNFVICDGCVHGIFDYEARNGVAFNVKRVLVPLRSNRVLRWGYNLSKCLGYLELLRVQQSQVDCH